MTSPFGSPTLPWANGVVLFPDGLAKYIGRRVEEGGGGQGVPAEVTDYGGCMHRRQLLNQGFHPIEGRRSEAPPSPTGARAGRAVDRAALVHVLVTTSIFCLVGAAMVIHRWWIVVELRTAWPMGCSSWGSPPSLER